MEHNVGRWWLESEAICGKEEELVVGGTGFDALVLHTALRECAPDVP